MPSRPTEDSFAPFDIRLRQAANAETPWHAGRYVPDLDLLRTLLTVPISQGDKQESGRTAKALDAWIAQELRRAGFPADAVWPRPRRPRVLGADLSALEARLDDVESLLWLHEQKTGQRLKPVELRRAIKALAMVRPGSHEAYILGDFYSKQVDVGMSSWRRGPDILISTKTMFSSHRNNLRNRHEEAVGEISSLRRRHPMAAMGFAFLVRSDIYEDEGSYAILNDILSRLRRAEVTFDATLLLVVEWKDDTPDQLALDEPDLNLAAGRFFSDIINSVTTRSPIQEHQEVRKRRDGEPIGGAPDPEYDDIVPDSAGESDNESPTH